MLKRIGMDNVFDNSLSDEQRKVAVCDQNILLLASAGTGKTKTMAAKILRLINEKQMDPSRILCLTFTNKACEETKERLLSAVGKDSLAVTVRTFHSFCFEIIDSEKRRSSAFFPQHVIYDEDDCQEIVNEFASSYREGTNDYINWALRYREEIFAFINLVKGYRLSKQIFSDDDVSDIVAAFLLLEKNDPDLLKKALRKNSSASDFLFRNGEAFLRLFESRLEENHAMDFNDLVTGVFRLFLNPETVERWKNKFSFIGIDEAQDTSVPEYGLIERLFGDSQIMLSGDFFQTIYQWRGSSPQTIIKEFSDKYSPVFFRLDENYRSTQTLTNASFAVLVSLFGDQARGFYPNGVKAMSSEEGDPVFVGSASDPESEAEKIYRKIAELSSHYPLSSMCVLTRSNSYGLGIASHFRSKGDGIGCFLIGDLKFYRRPEIKDVFAFLRLLLNPHDSLSVFRIAGNYISGVGPVTLGKISEEVKAGTCLSLSDFIDLDTLRSGDPYSLLFQKLGEGKVVVFDTETTGLDVRKDQIVQISAAKIGEGRKKIDAFDEFIRPTISVGDSAKIHGYTDEFLKAKGRPAKDVLAEFASFADGCVLVGHNVSFDLGILSSEFERNSLESPDFSKFYDTCLMAKQVYPRGPKNYKLSYLSQDYFGFEHKSSHRAGDDVMATVDLLTKMIDDDLRDGCLIRQRVVGEYGRRFEKFAQAVDSLRKKSETMGIDDLIREVIETMRIREHYKDSIDKQQALDNLIANAEITKREHSSTRDSIQDFLNMASLSNTEIDAMCKDKNILPIITIHQSKGAEFDVVFIAGMAEGRFPNYYGDPEEEKRLFYVAFTRAKEKLFISYPRVINSFSSYPSEFLSLLSKQYIQNW